MQRRRKKAGTQDRGPSTRFDERHLVRPANLILDANPPVKLDQICARTKQHVLAIIDDFAGGRMLIGRSPSAKIGTALEQRDLYSALREGASRGNPGQSASNHRNVWALGRAIIHACKAI